MIILLQLSGPRRSGPRRRPKLNLGENWRLEIVYVSQLRETRVFVGKRAYC